MVLLKGAPGPRIDLISSLISAIFSDRDLTYSSYMVIENPLDFDALSQVETVLGSRYVLFGLISKVTFRIPSKDL